MPDVDILRINGTDYKVHDSDGRALVAPEELAPTATKAHAIGEPFVYDGKLYRATAAIAIGDPITTTGTGENAAQVPGGVSGEVAELKSAFPRFEHPGNNIVTEMLYTQGGYYGSNGVFVQSESWGYTDLIPVEAGKTYYINTPTNQYICLYDSNKDFVSGVAAQSVTIPASGVSYIRVSMSPNRQKTARLTVGGVYTDYVETLKSDAYIVRKNLNIKVVQNTPTAGVKTANVQTLVEDRQNFRGGNWLHINVVSASDEAVSYTVFGFYGATIGDGYDNLGTMTFGASFDTTLTRDYYQIQISSGTAESAPFSCSFAYAFGDKNVGLMPLIYKNEADISSMANRVTELEKFKANTMLCSIFNKIICCGDSYTAGYINYNDQLQVKPDFSWPHYFERLTGVPCVICASSGADVLSWQTRSNCLPAAQTEGFTQAYIVGLGINDMTLVPLGSASDIGTAEETYYGGLSTIVRKLNAISPTAKIFLQTMPRSDGVAPDYNQAVRDVVTAYASTYPVHLLDLYQYRSLYGIPSISQDATAGHFTAIGYQQFAAILAHVLSDYISSHVSEFKDLYLIPYSGT